MNRREDPILFIETQVKNIREKDGINKRLNSLTCSYLLLYLKALRSELKEEMDEYRANMVCANEVRENIKTEFGIEPYELISRHTSL